MVGMGSEGCGDMASQLIEQTAPWLLDLRRLQKRSCVGSSPEDQAESLATFLELAPCEVLDSVGIALLEADPDWAVTPAAAVLLNWLKNRPRFLCWRPWLSSEATDILLIWHGITKVCEPWPLEAYWTWREISNPQCFGRRPQAGLHGRGERLAFFSPLPPQRSGICDYSLALIPALSKYFQIDVVATDPSVKRVPEGAQRILTVDQFYKARNEYHHVLYNLGNSLNHLEMMAVLQLCPGAVVLHDFYLSNILCSNEAERCLGLSASSRFYQAHGYRTSLEWETSQSQGHAAPICAYPLNLAPLQRAGAVIVHSQEACRLGQHFFGDKVIADWDLIPHLKQLSNLDGRLSHRAKLRFRPEQFVVCSFGFVSRSKLAGVLLEAFLDSDLATDPNVALVFVGSGEADPVLWNALKLLLSQARTHRKVLAEIRLTGWADPETYLAYQASADVAVQLRTNSRGESSGTVLDCLATGIPLIYNANGSLAELPEGCGVCLPNVFRAVDLLKAVRRLYQDSELRQSLAQRGRQIVLTQHRPEVCAMLYYLAIRRSTERLARRQAVVRHARPLMEQISGLVEDPGQELGIALAMLIPANYGEKQFFLDVTAIAEHDLGSGVQRVVRSICWELLLHPPHGWRVEPVRSQPDGLGYLYARQFTSSFLGLKQIVMPDGPVIPRQGDLFLGIDLHHNGVLRQRAYFQLLRAHGVSVYFVVHDLLPCLLPQCFPPDAAELHEAWLGVVAECDGALAVSRTVAKDLRVWLQEHFRGGIMDRFAIHWFHHGCDFQLAASPGADPRPMRTDSIELPCTDTPTLLMVGTIEPRKAYLDVIEAVNLLWKQGLEFRLVIVGREGWQNLPESSRGSIPQTVGLLRRHNRLGKKLFWLENASDIELAQLYQDADGLIAASYGEGFGIPLIEAASQGLPLLVRDLPVFQEVTNGAASTFPVNADREQLAAAIAAFIDQIKHPQGHTTTGLSAKQQSWRQATDQILMALGIDPSLRDEPLKFSSSPSPVIAETDDPLQVRMPRRSQWRRLLRRIFWQDSDIASGAGDPQADGSLDISGQPRAEMPEVLAWLHDLRSSAINPQTFD